MKRKENLIRIITGIICGLSVLSLIVTIVSSISMLLGFDVNIQSKLLTLISTSDIISTETYLYVHWSYCLLKYK